MDEQLCLAFRELLNWCKNKEAVSALFSWIQEALVNNPDCISYETAYELGILTGKRLIELREGEMK